MSPRPPPTRDTGPSVLVLGGSGLLGTELVAATRERGWAVSAPSSAEVDITDPGAVIAALDLLRPHVVINAAAWTDVDACEADPTRAYRVNTAAAGALADACTARGIRLLHLSTDYVFGGDDPPRTDDGTPRGWREDDTPAPVNVYGHSKLAGELLVHRADPDHLVVRTAWLSGGGGGFVPTILRAARERVDPVAGPRREPLSGVVDRTGSPTVAHHLAVGVLDAIEVGATGTLHLVGGGAATWFDVARWVVEVAGLDIEVEPCPASAFPQQAARPAWSVLDGTRAHELRVPCADWRAQVADLVAALVRRPTAG